MILLAALSTEGRNKEIKEKNSKFNIGTNEGEKITKSNKRKRPD